MSSERSHGSVASMVDWMAMHCWGKVGCKLQSPATLHTQLGYTAIHFTLENPYSSCIFSLSPSDSGNCNCAFITNPVAERTTYLRSMFARLKGGETFLYRGFAFLDAQASLAPTQVSLLVRWLVDNTFKFPFYQRV